MITLTDLQGNILERQHFFPFGGYRAPIDHDFTHRGFTNHQHNDDLGLIYMNARHYLPSAGRFISADTLVPDPSDPQAWNRYTYVLSNPLKYSDPTGHFSENEIETYFGYTGETIDELRRNMFNDGWNEELVNWLLDADTTWGDVATLYNDSGQRLGEAMLVLFEAQQAYSRRYRGGLYGLNGAIIGGEVSPLGSFATLDDHSSQAVEAQRAYQNNYGDLPSLGDDILIPGTFYQRDLIGDIGGVATIAGVATVGATCVVSVVGIPACLGTGAALVGTGATIVGGVTYIARPSRAVHLPVIFQPDIGPTGVLYRSSGIWTMDYAPPKGFRK